MKKLLTLTLAILLCLSVFAGCNTPQTPDDSNTPEPPKDVIDDYDNENEIEVEIGGDNEGNENNNDNEIENKPNDENKDPDKQPVTGPEHTNTIGKFVAKDKTYAYQGNNVTILKLENQSEANCTVTIHAKFLNADGTVLKTETQNFEGFPAYWSNYFVFHPEIPFAQFQYTLDLGEFSGECPVSSDLKAYALSLREEKFPIFERVQQYQDYEKYPSILCNFVFEHLPAVRLRGYYILFDNQGEICYLAFYLMHPVAEALREGQGVTQVLLQTTDDEIVWPKNLTGDVSGIVSMVIDDDPS